MNLFRHDVSHEIRAYLYHRFFLRASLIVSTVFAWLLMFEILFMRSGTIGYALGGTALLYAASHTLSFFLIPLGARALQWGTRRVSAFATVAHIGAMLSLTIGFLSASQSQDTLLLGIIGFLVLSALYRALYVIPYHCNVDMGFTAGRSLTGEVLLSLVPLIIGGFFVASPYGPAIALSIAAVSASLALLLLSLTPTTSERYAYTYSETLQNLFRTDSSHTFGHALFSGIQGAGLLFVWPLAMFLLLNGSYYLLGAIMSITLFSVFFIRLLGGTWRSAHRPPSSLYPFVTGSAWVLRFFSYTPILFVAADILHYALVHPRGFHVDLLVHEQDADAGSYVDSRTVVKEMGLTLGRVFLALLLASLALLVSPLGALGIAVVCAVLASLVQFTVRESAYM